MLNSAIGNESGVDDWPYIPKEAFLYFPSQIHGGAGKSYTRKIFEGNIRYQDFEEKKIQELDEALSKSHKTLMPWFTKANKLRFIQASKFDISKTIKSVVENNQWRLKTFPIHKSSFAESFIQSGAIYICGRDHCYRPIIVIDLSRFDTNNSQIQKPQFMSKILAVFFEFMITHMFIQGQVENYVMIINLNSLMMFAIGGIAKRLLQFTNNMYRGRLFMAYIVNTSSGITFFWKPVQSFLSQNTLKKIILTDKSFSQELFQHTNPSQIEQKYGGTLPNITSNFFPPFLHSNNFLLKSERIQTKLISKQQYLNLYKNGKLQERKICKQLVAGGAVEQDMRTSIAKQSQIVRPFSPMISKKLSIGSMHHGYRPSQQIKNQPMQNNNTFVTPQQMVMTSQINQNNLYNNRNSRQNINTPNTVSPPPSYSPAPQFVVLPVVVQQQSLRRKDSLQQQMLMDLQYIGANSLGGTNQIINIPFGQYPVHRTLSVNTFFQQGQYIGMKRMFNPSFRS